MYALSFDMNIAELEEHYGSPYHGAYYEIKRTLFKHGFYWIQGSTYMTNADNLPTSSMPSKPSSNYAPQPKVK